MSSEFQRCIDDHKLKPFKATKQMIEKELESAGYDLKRAQESLNEGDAKWSTVQSYYAIFHSARALLFNRGYRERSHRCLLIALQELYVRTGELPPEYIDIFRLAMDLREDADYGFIYDKESAYDLLQNAKKFNNYVLKYLKDT